MEQLQELRLRRDGSQCAQSKHLELGLDLDIARRHHQLELAIGLELTSRERPRGSLGGGYHSSSSSPSSLSSKMLFASQCSDCDQVEKEDEEDDEVASQGDSKRPSQLKFQQEARGGGSPFTLARLIIFLLVVGRELLLDNPHEPGNRDSLEWDLASRRLHEHQTRVLSSATQLNNLINISHQEPCLSPSSSPVVLFDTEFGTPGALRLFATGLGGLWRRPWLLACAALELAREAPQDQRTRTETSGAQNVTATGAQSEEHGEDEHKKPIRTPISSGPTKALNGAASLSSEAAEVSTVGSRGQTSDTDYDGRELEKQKKHEKQQQLEAVGQINNNNNNETKPTQKPEPPTTSHQNQSAAADLEQTTTIGSRRWQDVVAAAKQEVGPNSVARSENATVQVHAKLHDQGESQNPDKQRHRANLMVPPMTRQNMREAKSTARMRRQQQQQHLTMTSAKKKAQDWASAEMSPRDAEHKEQAGTSSPELAMNSVICNSRCQCVQLEFGVLSAGRLESSPNSNSNTYSQANSKANPKLNEIESSQQRPESGPLARTTPNETTTTASDRAEIESDDSSSSGVNRRALIEFSQDYSFEDEDEANEATAATPPPPSQEASEASSGLESDAQGERTTSTHQTAKAPPERSRQGENAATSPTRTQKVPADKSEQTTAGLGGNGQHQAQSGGGNVDRLPSLFSALSAAFSSSAAAVATEAASAPSSSEPTIKHANDQSKVVNVSSAPTAAPAPEPKASQLQAVSSQAAPVAVAGAVNGEAAPPPPMLSIKDNKTGADESDANGRRAATSAKETPAARVKSNADHHTTNDLTTDKENLGLSTLLSPASGGGGNPKPQAVNFYPLLAARLHQQHHNHHYLQHRQHQHQYRNQNSNIQGPLPSPFLIKSSHEGGKFAFDRSSSADEPAERPIRSIAPLRSRAATNLSSPGAMVQLLNQIERDQIQSLSLSGQQMKFELWTEVYALLSLQLRHDLYHLDLSHNSLLKLGVTFTGYIEHHLAYQLVAHRNQTWPFSSTHQLQSSGSASSKQQLQNSTAGYLPSSGFFKLIQLQAKSPPAGSSSPTVQTTAPSRRASSNGSLRHPNLGDGRLYNAVRAERPLDVSLMTLQHNSTGNEPQNSRPNQQAPTLTVLHQAARVKALDLSHNKLRWLINEQFRILKHVEAIRLDHNQIRYIHSQAFQGLEALKYLNLAHNRIQTIYMEQFQTNYNLRALFLQSNYLTYLRAGSFASLSQLKRLDLSRNKFTLLSNNAFVGLDSLELLNMSSNQFVHAPSSSLHALAGSLKRLDLSRNQVGQLMPGTFFHLKLEQLWLDHNGQLAVIDRGAFWDLPYLRQLSLNSNQMLVSVNSQAFVGVPSLATINADQCPLLEDEARQLLDNVTSTATLRQLKQANDPQLQEPPQARSLGAGLATGPVQPVSSAAKQMVAMLPLRTNQQASGELFNESLAGQPLGALKWTLVKCVYPMAWVVLFVVALKLVFKYTSTRHYLDARRRRRRVYQTSSSTPSASHDDDCTSSSGDSSSGRRDDLDEDLASSLEDLEQQQQNSEGNPGQSLMMREQQPYNVIRRSLVAQGPQDEAATSPNNADGGSSSTDREQVEVASEQPQVVDCQCLDVMATSADTSQQFNMAANFGSSHFNLCVGCPECCSQQQQQHQGLVTDAHSQQSRVVNLGTAGSDLTHTNQPNLTDASNTNTHCDNEANTSLEGAQVAAGSVVGPVDGVGLTTTAICHHHPATIAAASAATADTNNDNPQQDPRNNHKHLDLIHNQLVAAGFDYGHANCDHFYQSLGPALQLANLEANFVNQMDYYS